MDETVTTTKNALWAGRIQNFYSSGLSRKAWCQTNNVPLSTLSYWIRKLAKGSGEQQQDHELFLPECLQNMKYAQKKPMPSLRSLYIFPGISGLK